MTDDNDKTTIELLPTVAAPPPPVILRTITNKLAENVMHVFDYWRVMTQHTRSRLDVKRAKAIRDMLTIGYSVGDLCLAIDGCIASDFHQGGNQNGTVYDELCLILRDAAHVDSFIRKGEAAHRRLEAAKQRVAQAEENWTPPTDDEKMRVRDLLRALKIKRA